MKPPQTSPVFRAFIWTVVITALHFSLSTQSHGVHWIHILLAGFYLVPVLILAVSFEWKGGLLASACVSLLYLLHLLWSWRDSPMTNPDQFAWLAIYPIVGLVAGQLVHKANYRKWQRDEIIVRSRHAEMVNGITGLLTAVGVRDQASISHAQRVAGVSMLIGKDLGFDQQALSDLHLAALVHDIGKAGIPDAILFKQGRLEDEQMSMMHEHVELAVSMLDKIPGSGDIARLVAQHHECPDGSGYPHGLTAERIDPAAAALRVADVYSALTEERPYHDAMSTPEALLAMDEIDGAKLDSVSFSALRRIVGRSADTDAEEILLPPAGEEHG